MSSDNISRVTAVRFSEKHIAKAAELERKYFSEPWSENSLRLLCTEDYPSFALCSDDGALLGYLSAAKAPDELQIISYDGIFKQWGISNITSVEQPIEEMARQVVRLLIKKIHNEETCHRTVLKTKFVLGKTTK